MIGELVADPDAEHEEDEEVVAAPQAKAKKGKKKAATTFAALAMHEQEDHPELQVGDVTWETHCFSKGIVMLFLEGHGKMQR